MKAKRLIRLVKIVTCVATALVVGLVAVIVIEYVKISSLNKKINATAENVKALNEQKETLEASLDTHSSNEYKDDYAHRVLRMLPNGEIYIEFEE